MQARSHIKSKSRAKVLKKKTLALSDIDPSFEQRKKDHIRIALSPETQTSKYSGLDDFELKLNALPNLDFADLKLNTKIFGHDFSSPFFISSMTAGHQQSLAINEFLAGISAELNMFCGVGSQRKEIESQAARAEWRSIRKAHPKAKLMGNLGAAQLVRFKAEKALELIDSLEAFAFFIHLNALQEALQPEGTPQFRGFLKELHRLVRMSPVPIVVKEVGSGFSAENMKALDQIGVAAIDVAGLGGTHWGRVEGLRSQAGTMLSRAAETYANWGRSTAECLLEGSNLNLKCSLWASGGIRSGLDAAKVCALGASAVGIAQPWMKIFTGYDKNKRSQAAHEFFELLCYEMKIAMFCTESEKILDLRGKTQWNKKPLR